MGRKAQKPLPTVVGLFAGIGGIELGFKRAGYKTIMLCECDDAAKNVLRKNFPGTRLVSDVRKIKSLPACDVLTAGFPCQDLSQVGRRVGINGENSGLIKAVFTLLDGPNTPKWLLLENVPFMLRLNKGQAMEMIVEELEARGWHWAYRIIDSRAFGLPQRRERVVILASKTEDPRPILLAQDSMAPKSSKEATSCGFYWTEGNTGIGWAENAIPPLKGGSAVGIPSPPAIWIKNKRQIVVPDIRDAERLQGFPANWTKSPICEEVGHRHRWKLVGNAVSVPLSEWIACRLNSINQYDSARDLPLQSSQWPDAAWGFNGLRYVANVSSFPITVNAPDLIDFLKYPIKVLSYKATKGFLSRLTRSSLKYPKAFADDLKKQVSSYEVA